MKALGRRQRAIGLGAGVLSLLFAHAFAMTRASAGYSHRIDHPAGRISEIFALESIISGEPAEFSRVLPTARAPNNSVPTRPRPCSGLKCSNRTPSPVSTEINRTLRNDQYAMAATNRRIDGSSVEADPFDEPLAAPRQRLTSIFHPP